jgi:hypothetical protein|tara:strand:- start:1700 stop:1942 length:243 start_codon:yes stop_codon:yes gene_type:complete
MAIKGVVNRQGAIGGRVQGTGNVRARQVAIGSGAAGTDITQKSIQELNDVDAAETDKGLLQYDQASDKWKTTNVIDGGTF